MKMFFFLLTTWIFPVFAEESKIISYNTAQEYVEQTYLSNSEVTTEMNCFQTVYLKNLETKKYEIRRNKVHFEKNTFKFGIDKYEWLENGENEHEFFKSISHVKFVDANSWTIETTSEFITKGENPEVSTSRQIISYELLNGVPTRIAIFVDGKAMESNQYRGSVSEPIGESTINYYFQIQSNPKNSLDSKLQHTRRETLCVSKIVKP